MVRTPPPLETPGTSPTRVWEQQEWGGVLKNEHWALSSFFVNRLECIPYRPNFKDLRKYLILSATCVYTQKKQIQKMN